MDPRVAFAEIHLALTFKTVLLLSWRRHTLATKSYEEKSGNNKLSMEVEAIGKLKNMQLPSTNEPSLANIRPH
jgi:hypothetical protein